MGILGKDKEDSIIWNMGMEIEEEKRISELEDSIKSLSDRIKELEAENKQLKRNLKFGEILYDNLKREKG